MSGSPLVHRRRKADRNQAAIVDALRTVGCSVQPLHGAGSGVPDLLVGYRGVNLLMEVKNGKRGKLTPAQYVWHRDWRGPLAVVRSVEEALTVLEGVGDGRGELPY